MPSPIIICIKAAQISFELKACGKCSTLYYWTWKRVGGNTYKKKN